MFDLDGIEFIIWTGIGAIVGMIFLAIAFIVNFFIDVPTIVFFLSGAIPVLIGVAQGFRDS